MTTATREDILPPGRSRYGNRRLSFPHSPQREVLLVLRHLGGPQRRKRPPPPTPPRPEPGEEGKRTRANASRDTQQGEGGWSRCGLVVGWGRDGESVCRRFFIAPPAPPRGLKTLIMGADKVLFSLKKDHTLPNPS